MNERVKLAVITDRRFLVEFLDGNARAYSDGLVELLIRQATARSIRVSARDVRKEVQLHSWKFWK